MNDTYYQCPTLSPLFCSRPTMLRCPSVALPCPTINECVPPPTYGCWPHGQQGFVGAGLSQPPMCPPPLSMPACPTLTPGCGPLSAPPCPSVPCGGPGGGGQAAAGWTTGCPFSAPCPQPSVDVCPQPSVDVCPTMGCPPGQAGFGQVGIQTMDQPCFTVTLDRFCFSRSPQCVTGAPEQCFSQAPHQCFTRFGPLWQRVKIS